MDEHDNCPHCSHPMETGHIGFYTGLWWYERRLDGLARAFPYAVSQGELVAGHWTSPGWVRMVDGRRCGECGTVVLPPTA